MKKLLIRLAINAVALYAAVAIMDGKGLPLKPKIGLILSGWH